MQRQYYGARFDCCRTYRRLVLRGTSIAGGRGVVIGMAVGIMVLAILDNGLNLVGVSFYLQSLIKAGIILLAVYIGRDP